MPYYNFHSGYIPAYFVLGDFLCYYGNSKSHANYRMSNKLLKLYSFLPDGFDGRCWGKHFFLLDGVDLKSYIFEEPSNFEQSCQLKTFFKNENQQHYSDFAVWKNFVIKMAPNEVDSTQLDVFTFFESDSTLENIFTRCGFPSWEYNLKIEINDNILVIGFDWEDKLYVFKNNLDLYTSVNKASSLPKTTRLFQNYPNPFNATTQISFEIAKNGHVKLTVHDLLGRQVQRLVNEHKQPGTYAVKVDGTMLASGIYYYKLQTDNRTLCKKFTLLR